LYYYKKTTDDVRYFKESEFLDFEKAAQAIDLKRKTLRKILKDVIKMHLYEISTRQVLTVTPMKKRVKFCKTMVEMFENFEKTDYFYD